MSRTVLSLVVLSACLAAPAAAQQSAGSGGRPSPGSSLPLAPQAPLGTSPATGQRPSGPEQSNGSPQPNGLEQAPGGRDDDTEPPVRGSRSNGALFGGADTASQSRTRALDLSLSLASAYDDDLTEGQGGLIQPFGGEFSDVSALLSFRRTAQHARVTARGATSIRHYPSLHRFVGSSHSGGTDLALDLSRRTTLRASVDGTYVSEFAFDTISRQSGLGNAALVSTGVGLMSLDGARLSYGAATQLTRKVGQRSMFSVNVGARANERRTFDESIDERTLGSSFVRAIGRYTSVGIGYSHRTSSQRLGGVPRPISGDELQAALDHTWWHSRQRRTVFSVSAGPSLVHGAVDTRGSGATDRLDLVGSVALSHDMSRSWNLGASFRRAGGTIDGLRSDSASIDLHGLLSRRADLTISAGYLGADLAVGVGESRYTTLFGSGRIQVALSRMVAIYGQYVVYDYDFGTAIPLIGAIPQQHRRGVRGGLTLWMPLHEGR